MCVRAFVCVSVCVFACMRLCVCIRVCMLPLEQSQGIQTITKPALQKSLCRVEALFR